MKNNFSRQQFYDHTIVNGAGKRVGTIRIKPNSVLWAWAGSHDWYGVTLKEFGRFLVDKGKKQKK